MMKHILEDVEKNYSHVVMYSYNIGFSLLFIKDCIEELNDLDLLSYDDFVFLNNKLDDFLENYKAVFDVD